MILDGLANHSRYDTLHPGLSAGFRFLNTTKLDELPEGCLAIDGDRLFAIVARVPGRGRSESPLEAHDKYIDIQYAVADVDEIGFKQRSQCQTVSTPMDTERDIMFFRDEPDFWFTLKGGMFAVFYPDDAHAPLAGSGPTYKVVVKVAVHGW